MKAVYFLLLSMLFTSHTALAVTVHNHSDSNQRILILEGKNVAQTVTLAPTHSWSGPQVATYVNLPDSAKPQAVHTIMDRDTWIIWKSKEFLLQHRRKEISHGN